MPERMKCAACSETGKCLKCNGTGREKIVGTWGYDFRDCPKCNGSEKCQECKKP